MSGLAAVALGSNLDSGFGDRRANLVEAVRRIGELGEVRAVSSFYDTEPVGYLSQPRFLNGALLLQTNLEPVELLRGLLAVERAMGREREGVVEKGPRVIDLDLLVYIDQSGIDQGGTDQRAVDLRGQTGINLSGGQVVMETDELTLPHPAMQERRFVLEPLAEIAPEMMHPVLGLTMRELLARLG